MTKKEALSEVLKQLEEKANKAAEKGNWTLLCYTAGQISVVKKLKEATEEKKNE